MPEVGDTNELCLKRSDDNNKEGEGETLEAQPSRP